MSFPNFTNVKPVINIKGKQAYYLMLSSIAFEELGLAHLINAEAEKVQYALSLGKVEDLIKINDSVTNTMKNVIKNQMLLQFKLENILFKKFTVIQSNTATVTAQFDGITLSGSDIAYYHTVGVL